MIRMSNDNLYAVLSAGFNRDSSASAIETRDAQGQVLYYTWGDIDRATAEAVASVICAAILSLRTLSTWILPGKHTFPFTKKTTGSRRGKSS